MKDTNLITITQRAYPVGATELIHKYCCMCQTNLEHLSESRIDAVEPIHWYRCPKCGEVCRDTLKYPRIVYYIMNGSRIERYEKEL